MLPRRSRLSREGFDSIMRSRRYSSPHFSLSIQENGLYSGLGIVISKKVAKLAVSRHLLKRRISSVLAPFYTDTRAIAVFAKPGSKELPFPELKTELLGLLEDAGIR